ncbi:Uncharacterised protein [Zhongshania aliphaticivorans]|uniref:HTH cro/C1-type domain-containing protein n=1 Tax=Zhongshania aliphaticivorans TaxID=1470434 RepID=A0A5S9PQY1_9GAMM|nr:hypothetical protein [Zhongshania aliphaticivorans]CAA0106502.1 Uncharacterised protein [Zhongshania aliphaticivorans]CAA0106660.1 Uncharacterised protein [Zhongshania aliphaticivorans]
MKIDEVPQDSENSTYGNAHKLIYAADEHGDFIGVKSSGWIVEAEATQSALKLIEQQCDEAWRRAYNGETAALEYFMYFRRMDLALLAQVSGLYQWRIRRHFKPEIFKKLSPKLLHRYSEALGLEIDFLKQLPAHPLHGSQVHV